MKKKTAAKKATAPEESKALTTTAPREELAPAGPPIDALAFIDQPTPEVLEMVLAQGDISKLSTPQRLQFLAAVCRSIGVNAITRPFEIITLKGKMTIYAKKDCTEQLRRNRNVSVEITKREIIGEILRISAKATLPDGRHDEDVGAVSVRGLSGEDLANAEMKAITKAKRRVTLSICGLGFLDESEVSDIQQREQRERPQPMAEGLEVPAVVDKPASEVRDVESEVMPADGAGGPQHWSALLTDDVFRTVKMPKGFAHEGKSIHEMSQDGAVPLQESFESIPRNSEEPNVILARNALDAAYFHTITVMLKKGKMELSEAEYVLEQEGKINEGQHMIDLEGSALKEIKDLLRSKMPK